MNAKPVSTPVRRKKKSYTPEENRALNESMVLKNKTLIAFRKNKGAFVIYDPTFLNT